MNEHKATLLKEFSEEEINLWFKRGKFSIHKPESGIFAMSSQLQKDLIGYRAIRYHYMKESGQSTDKEFSKNAYQMGLEARRRSLNNHITAKYRTLTFQKPSYTSYNQPAAKGYLHQEFALKDLIDLQQ